mgnify:CR=1 FL=1
MNKKYAELDFPAWFDGKDVNEATFCREFLSKNKLIYADNAFFTPDGRLTDPLLLKEKIYAELSQQPLPAGRKVLELHRVDSRRVDSQVSRETFAFD